MAECSSSFIAPHSEKEENTELINDCTAKGGLGEDYKQ